MNKVEKTLGCVKKIRQISVGCFFQFIFFFSSPDD